MEHRLPALFIIVCMVPGMTSFPTAGAAEDASTELVVLSTTDMHGKCWETNLLTKENTSGSGSGSR